MASGRSRKRKTHQNSKSWDDGNHDNTIFWNNGPEVFSRLWARICKQLDFDSADILPTHLDIKENDRILNRLLLVVVDGSRGVHR
jgi:hypothetical protein